MAGLISAYEWARDSRVGNWIGFWLMHLRDVILDLFTREPLKIRCANRFRLFGACYKSATRGVEDSPFPIYCDVCAFESDPYLGEMTRLQAFEKSRPEMV